MSQTFTPPTQDVGLGNSLSTEARERFWSRVKMDSGIALVKFPDGTYRTTDLVDRESYPEGSTVYDGGHIYEVTTDEAAALAAAGYGPYITWHGYGLAPYGIAPYGGSSNG